MEKAEGEVDEEKDRGGCTCKRPVVARRTS
jgi:hypothetical protein